VSKEERRRNITLLLCDRIIEFMYFLCAEEEGNSPYEFVAAVGDQVEEARAYAYRHGRGDVEEICA
jgi:hypothetical protein